MISVTGKVGRLPRKGIVATVTFILILIVVVAAYFIVASSLKNRLDNTPEKQSHGESVANIDKTRANAEKSSHANPLTTSISSRYNDYKDNTGWITDAITNSWGDIYNKDGYDAYVEQIKQDFIKNGQTFDINNPYDGKLVGKVQ